MVMQEAEQALKVKAAQEKSLQDTVRRLRARETQERLAAAQRGREREQSIARERAAWRAPVRELISMLSDALLLTAEVRVGVSEEERIRRGARVPRRGSAQVSCLPAIAAPAAAEDGRAETVSAGQGSASTSWLVQVWQESPITPEQEVAALREQVQGGEQQLDMLRVKQSARDTLHEQLQSEHAALRREFLALQLQLKISHESCWASEEELVAMRSKLSARFFFFLVTMLPLSLPFSVTAKSPAPCFVSVPVFLLCARCNMMLGSWDSFHCRRFICWLCGAVRASAAVSSSYWTVYKFFACNYYCCQAGLGLRV